MNEEIDGTTNPLKHANSKTQPHRRIIHVLDKDYHALSVPSTTTYQDRTMLTVNSHKLDFLNDNQEQQLELKDILITIKTTQPNHRSRLKPIIDTWFKLLPSNIFFITDEPDELFSLLTGFFCWITVC